MTVSTDGFIGVGDTVRFSMDLYTGNEDDVDCPNGRGVVTFVDDRLAYVRTTPGCGAWMPIARLSKSSKALSLKPNGWR